MNSFIDQDDRQLFQQLAATRNSEAFDLLFRRWYGRMIAFASQYVGTSDAENIVQDVMTYLWENTTRINLKNSVSTYLFTAVKYRCLTLISRGQVAHKVLNSLRMDFIEEVAALSETDSVLYTEMRAIYLKTLASLPENQREAFNLSRYEDMTYDKIAMKQNVSEKTVEYRISQALKRLREALADYIPR